MSFMETTPWTAADTQRAEQIWAEFLAHNDLSAQIGQAAGIDPASGRIWFGKSAIEVVDRMNSEGFFVPLYFVRIGFPTYWCKGGRFPRRARTLDREALNGGIRPNG